MSCNYFRSFIDDPSGISDSGSAPPDVESIPILGNGYFSIRPCTNATSTPDDPHSSRLLNAKVPIPRISNPGIIKARHRVSQACEACRAQKAKCNGHQPACDRCVQSGSECSYGDRKRERTIKQLTDMTIRAQTFERILRTLQPQLDSAAAELIEQALTRVRRAQIDVEGAARNNNTQAPTEILREPQLLYGSVFSLRTLDYTEEDLNQNSRLQSMGFIAEPSEMACLYRLKSQLDRSISESTCDQSIFQMTYFLDDANLPVDTEADLSKWPSKKVADLLLNHYFDFIHPVFPALGMRAFTGQYRRFFSNTYMQPGSRWLALLNIVFAIAARRLLLTYDLQPVGFEDHLVFFQRAWQLNMNKEMTSCHSDLQQTQFEGLMAFYMLSIGHINRSWRIIGAAIRSGIAMGINLRGNTDGIAVLSEETRSRLWWALVVLEMVLCEMTGRPPYTSMNFCTTPLPLPYSEVDIENERVRKLITDNTIRNPVATSALPNIASTSSCNIIAGSAHSEANNGRKLEAEAMTKALIPNDSLCLPYMVELSLLMRDAVTTLYAPAAAQKPWDVVKFALCTLNDSVDRWLSRLPAELQFKDLRLGQPFLRQRISLAFQFYSTKLVLSQSCLYPVAGEVYEMKPVVAFCGNMASMCIKMAILTLNILPEKPDMVHLDYFPPWWFVLHYLMQSIVVLLVVLFTRVEAGTPEAVAILRSVVKATRWLEMMSSRDIFSKRAWVVCMDFLSTYGAKLEVKSEK